MVGAAAVVQTTAMSWSAHRPALLCPPNQPPPLSVIVSTEHSRVSFDLEAEE
jgi:hypothetical protein